MATVNVVELELSVVGRPFIQGKERRFKNGTRDPVQPGTIYLCSQAARRCHLQYLRDGRIKS